MAARRKEEHIECMGGYCRCLMLGAVLAHGLRARANFHCRQLRLLP